MQRDFYQAPPPESAQARLVTIVAQGVLSTTVTALSREDIELEVSDCFPGFVVGNMKRQEEAIGRLLVIGFPSGTTIPAAVEVRVGRYGNPREEVRLAEVVAAALSRPTADGTGDGTGDAGESQLPVHWTRATISGRWIDLEGSVAQAGATKGIVGYSILGVDRWRFATLFEIRSLADAEGRLVIVGDRESASGPVFAAVRLGRFGDPPAEAALLRRLQSALTDLGKVERLPGAR